MQAVAEQNVAVAVLSTLAGALASIRELERSGFDMSRVSLAGRDVHTLDRVVGYYSGGNGMKYSGHSGDLWESTWEVLTGWAFFAMPGIGPVLVAGPLAGWIVAGIDHAAIFNGLSCLGAAFHSIGISRGQIPEYEAALKGGKYLVLAHGIAGEVIRARQVLEAGK
jgi:hypothetical protein